MSLLKDQISRIIALTMGINPFWPKSDRRVADMQFVERTGWLECEEMPENSGHTVTDGHRGHDITGEMRVIGDTDEGTSKPQGQPDRPRLGIESTENPDRSECDHGMTAGQPQATGAPGFVGIGTEKIQPMMGIRFFTSDDEFEQFTEYCTTDYIDDQDQTCGQDRADMAFELAADAMALMEHHGGTHNQPDGQVAADAEHTMPILLAGIMRLHDLKDPCIHYGCDHQGNDEYHCEYDGFAFVRHFPCFIQ